MADFDGFLERRKKERNMERSTEMSQIDGMVNNLNFDIDKMMKSRREGIRQKMAQAQQD